MTTHVELERTDGYRYFTFRPPLPVEIFEELPMPQSAYIQGELARPSSVETDRAGQITAIGFETFSVEALVDYQRTLREHLNPKT